MLVDTRVSAKPFLKWAGGKGQLLEELFKRVPDIIKKTGVVTKYIEPFVGGGAFFFFLKSKFNVENAYLFDINPELIIAFKVVQREPENLIKKLKKLESKYLSSNKEERRKLYYEIRSLYNQQIYGFNYENYNEEWIERSAFLIFLNKTCYNGLYRQNRKGEFNVPFGDYKKPRICDSENILKVSRALKNIEIFTEDFSKSEKYVEAGTFLYLDPPYRPINQTSSFTDYSKYGFTDADQIRLAEFFKKMDKRGAYLLLSNSDPKNINPEDDFFERLYAGYKIERVLANRAISCVGSKRGPIYELIITNY